MPVSEMLTTLFDAERKARDAHRALLKEGRQELLRELEKSWSEAKTQKRDELVLRAIRIASILSELEGPEAVDQLIELLNSEWPEVRFPAGDALQKVASERFKEVAAGAERALAKLPNGSPALTELPYVIGSIEEGGSVKLLGHFLKHTSGDVVAAAIESLVDLGDPSAIKMLSALTKDGRKVELDEEEAEMVSIGELAEEACAILEEEA